jgi:hypothetical protein
MWHLELIATPEASPSAQSLGNLKKSGIARHHSAGTALLETVTSACAGNEMVANISKTEADRTTVQKL